MGQNSTEVAYGFGQHGSTFLEGDGAILDLTGSTLTVGTPGSTTLISATGIDVPNFRISNNTISTLQNGLTIDSAGTTNINANAQMNQNVTVSGDATIAGSGINFGDAPGDTINFSMDFTDNLLPSSNTSSNLGSANKQWRTANFERAEIDGIQIKDSTFIETIYLKPRDCTDNHVPFINQVIIFNIAYGAII